MFSPILQRVNRPLQSNIFHLKYNLLDYAIWHRQIALPIPFQRKLFAEVLFADDRVGGEFFGGALLEDLAFEE